MPILIISRKDGFRRCGIAHPAESASYPDEAFTPEQLAVLRGEPMLIIQVITGEPCSPSRLNGLNSKNKKQED